jgi:hypothetical protein
MEARIWRSLYAIVWEVAEELPRGGRRFPDAVIVITLLWAAFNNRPICWATARRNWPVWLQRWFDRVPTSTTMSRRLRRKSVQVFLDAVLQRAQRRLPKSLCIVIDGKPLVIGGGSKDRQAGYGRAVGGKAKGYKLHALIDLHGRVLNWLVAPMNKDEQTMARRLCRHVQHTGYGLVDSNYDSNKVFAEAAAAGIQMVGQRRKPFTGLGRHQQQPQRLRSIDLTESGSPFGQHLLHIRDAIERFFGNLTSFGAGLGPLPAWVRTHRRVRLWVHTKLIINAVRIDCRLTV